jgi:DNA-binding winged helix-turn-helix (wHTH) protein
MPGFNAMGWVMQWRFGPFRLDLEHACLWRQTQRVPLRPKTFDLLVYLVTRPGELVSREALLEAIWPDTVVAEGVLTTSVGELRKVLGETAKHPRFIATVHRRGYRFLAPVTAVESSPTSPRACGC